MTYNELEKLLKKNDCKLQHHGKKHDIWKSSKTGKEFPVPRHGTHEVPTGTLNSIKRDAGLE